MEEIEDELKAIQMFLEEHGYYAVFANRVARNSGFHDSILSYTILIAARYGAGPFMEIRRYRDAAVEINPEEFSKIPWPQYRLDLHHPESLKTITTVIDTFTEMYKAVDDGRIEIVEI